MLASLLSETELTFAEGMSIFIQQGLPSYMLNNFIFFNAFHHCFQYQVQQIWVGYRCFHNFHLLTNSNVNLIFAWCESDCWTAWKAALGGTDLFEKPSPGFGFCPRN